MREAHFWLLQLVTGVVLIALLGLHMIAIHLETILGFFGLGAGEALAYASVMERAASSSWTWFYIIFLALALYHGLYGLRTIILELSLSRTAGTVVTVLLLAIGIIAFSFGTYVTWQAYAG